MQYNFDLTRLGDNTEERSFRQGYYYGNIDRRPNKYRNTNLGLPLMYVLGYNFGFVGRTTEDDAWISIKLLLECRKE
jgi:hypothetical protein